MQTSYRLTSLACIVGTFVQAVIANLTAILFVPIMDLYGFSYVHLGILVGVNYAAQVAADVILSGLIDKKGFRFFTLPACLAALAGLVLFAAAPVLLQGHVFAGIIAATVIFAFAGGMLEVLLSPILDAIPGDAKGAAMSLMHSFYAWGQVAVIVLTTLFIHFAGSRCWPVVTLLWAVVPLVCFLMFLRAPFPQGTPAEKRQGMRQLLFRPFYLIALAAIFCGAGAEIVLNQWASTFMEKALLLPKVAGDLLGMCGFAAMLGLARLLYGIYGARIDISKVLVGGAALSLVCYLTVALSPFDLLNVAACALCGFAAGLLWPGTLVVASERYPLAGAWLFAVLAISGDIGGSFSAWLTGVVVDAAEGSGAAAFFTRFLGVEGEQAAMRVGLLTAAIFPLLALICHLTLKHMKKKKAAQAACKEDVS